MDKLRLLLKISSEMTKDKDLKKILLKLTNITKELLEADRCSIFLNDEKTNELWTIIAHGVKEIRIPNNVGIAGEVFTSKKPLNIKDAYSFPKFNKEIDKRTGYVTKNILAIPLINHVGETIGVFQVINKITDEQFSKYDTELLDHLAMYASSNIENVMLYEKLKTAQEDVVYKLSHATSYKDPETKNHIIRVGLYSAIIAKELNWTQENIELIRLAAPMHDIGKVGIPDKILNKPGKLTEEEYKIMKKHTLYGHDILHGGDSELSNTASIIALEHHEKWDGTGYPNNKRGEEISIYARITMVSDVFDALLSERPYKKAWPIEDVVKELKRTSGTHFDPRIVDLFETHLDKMIKIKKEFKDD
jgi:HD-GYP domain-containing protein (c-di-GMP phosphodiesterase class II)